MANGSYITIDQAFELTSTYQKANPDAIRALWFDKTFFEQILAQEDCEGIRIYYGLDSKGDNTLVLVGVDSKGDDLLSLIADFGTPCPFACSSTNALNP